ncbi:hypothetical protein ACI7RC_10790 [Brevibacillus sp. B_LB10_24]|uniref:hypothetical protein n=1 Tax=Brevibacillus sp. B_LB10_24 TaxID=3380645 RepID=UPI0038B6F20B
MLELLKVYKVSDERIEIDPYIPIDIRWELDNTHDRTLYWRTGDFKKSLLELGMSSQGVIRSITLTQTDNYFLDSLESNLIGLSVSSGLPVFNVAKVPENGFLDEEERFEVHLRDKEVCIKFGKSKNLTSLIQSGRVRFGIDQSGLLSMVAVVNLTELEYLQLKNTLQSTS